MLLYKELNEHKTKFFEYVNESKYSEIQKYLDDEKLFPWEYIEEDGYTALHRASFMDNLTTINIILNGMKKRTSEENIIKFVNQPTTFGFRAIHNASYRGNLQMIKKLIENGADVNLLNKRGLNVLHMAAQGNHPEPLIYFIDKYNMNLGCKDNLGSTPLHWACYTGALNSANFIIYRYSHLINFNEPDKEGLTPLHLAVLSENTQIIKKLLHKGADKTIEDNKNRTAVFLATEKNKLGIKDLFINDSTKNKCSRNKTFISPTGNQSKFNYFLFAFLHLVIQIPVFLILLPFINIPAISVIYILLFLIVLILYVGMSRSDPGNVMPGSTSFLVLVENNIQIKDFCPTCIIKKEYDTKHCYNCNRCVEGFDHHCMWINNCIGIKNAKNFRFFISFVMINIIFNMYIGIHAYFINIQIFPFTSYIPPVMPFADLYTLNIKNMVSIYVIMFCAMFSIPVSIILYINFRNALIKSKRAAKFENNGITVPIKQESISRAISLAEENTCCSDLDKKDDEKISLLG